MFSKLFKRVRDLYGEYPRQFWVLVFGMFIDVLGRTMLNPFLPVIAVRRQTQLPVEIQLKF